MLHTSTPADPRLHYQFLCPLTLVLLCAVASGRVSPARGLSLHPFAMTSTSPVSVSRIPTRATQPQRKHSLMRKYSTSITSTTTSPYASTSSSSPNPPLIDPDIGLDDSSDDETDERQSYSPRRTIKAKPTLPHTQHHHHHPSRPTASEHKERMSSPSVSTSRPSVSVTRDESPPAADSLASYDPSLLLTVTVLQQQLQQKDTELHQLSEALLLTQSSPSTTAASSPSSTSALVKDLMRQKRDLHLQLTRERQQHSQQLNDLRTSLLDEQQPTQCSECDKLKEEVSALQSRLNGSKAAVREWQKKSEKLESVLVRECGGADELNEATRERSEEKESADSSGGGWKGRAERVKELEKKVSALQAKLREQQTAAGGSQGSRQSPTTTAVDAAVDRKRDEEEKKRRKEWEEKDKQLIDLRDSKRLQAARVKTLEVEVGEMKQRLLVMVGKSDMDDSVIDRLKVERKQREEVRERDETRWQQKERSWHDRLQQLEAQLTDWQHRWQHGQQWQTAIAMLTKNEDDGRQREWTAERDALQSMIAQLQQRCDELTVDKLSAQQRNEVEAKRLAKARLSQPKAKVAAGVTVGSGPGEEERRRLVDMAGERELIRETYATMLERREEELEQWKVLRAREKDEELKMREEMKVEVVKLMQSMRQIQAIGE